MNLMRHLTVTTPVLCPLMFPARSIVTLSAKHVQEESKLNRKNTLCSYRRNSPCVGLRDSVEANELIVHRHGGLYHQSNVDDCLPNHIIWDGQKLHTNRIVRVHINVWRLRIVSSPVQKEYLKKYRLIYYSDQIQPKNKY